MSFMTLDDLVAMEAEERSRQHVNSSQRRVLTNDYDLIGFVGEWEFARVFGLPLNIKDNGRDGRIDFVLPLRTTVDVKCTRMTPPLLVEQQGKVGADVYALAHYDGAITEPHKRAKLVGWEMGKVLAKAPLRDLGSGVLNHVLEPGELRPISELLSRMMRLT